MTERRGPKPALYIFRGQPMTMVEIAALTGWSVASILRRRKGDYIVDRPVRRVMLRSQKRV